MGKIVLLNGATGFPMFMRSQNSATGSLKTHNGHIIMMEKRSHGLSSLNVSADYFWWHGRELDMRRLVEWRHVERAVQLRGHVLDI